MTTEKVKPCPFCGAAPQVVCTRLYYMQCPECHATTQGDTNDKVALAYWNQRVVEIDFDSPAYQNKLQKRANKHFLQAKLSKLIAERAGIEAEIEKLKQGAH
jgi:Lar family restriction alleviation protein